MPTTAGVEAAPHYDQLLVCHAADSTAAAAAAAAANGDACIAAVSRKLACTVIVFVAHQGRADQVDKIIEGVLIHAIQRLERLLPKMIVSVILPRRAPWQVKWHIIR